MPRAGHFKDKGGLPALQDGATEEMEGSVEGGSVHTSFVQLPRQAGYSALSEEQDQ